MLASPAPDGARTAPAPGTRDWAPGAGARTGCCWPPDAAGRTCGAASSQSTRHAPGTSAPPPKTTPAPPTRRATARHTTASRPPSAPPRGNDASPSQHGTAPPPRATPHRASPAKAPSRPRSDAAPVQETCTATQAGSPPQRGSALKSRSLSQNKNPPWFQRTPQYVLRANLEYAGPCRMGEGKHGAEIQIVGEHGVSVPFPPLHYDPVGGPWIPYHRPVDCLPSVIAEDANPVRRQVHVNQKLDAHECASGISRSSSLHAA